jgi:hypothetical protein
MAINAFGAVVTSVVLAVVIISKFTSGAWIVVVILPILVYMLHSLGVHHDRLVRHLRVASPSAARGFLAKEFQQRAVITVGKIDRAVLQAVHYARSLDAVVEAVYVTDDSSQAQDLRSRWSLMEVGVPLVVLESPIRAYTHALLQYLDFVERRSPGCYVTVILPEVLPTRWWHPLIHNYFAWRLKWILLFRPRTAVTSVPYEVRD